MPIAAPPGMVAAAASTRSALRLTSATLAPSAAKRCPTPRLIPLDPPATKTTLPAQIPSRKMSMTVRASGRLEFQRDRFRPADEVHRRHLRLAVEADGLQLGQQFFHQDAHFHAREELAEADVRAVPEGEVL